MWGVTSKVMVAQKGENVIVGSHFVPVAGVLNLEDYEVYCVVTDMSRNEVVRAKVDVVNAEDSAVAHIIPSSITEGMEGLYFVSFELWANGSKVLSNEVEQLTIY